QRSADEAAIKDEAFPQRAHTCFAPTLDEFVPEENDVKEFAARHAGHDEPNAEIVDALGVNPLSLRPLRRRHEAEQEPDRDQDAVGVDLKRAEVKKDRMHPAWAI